MPEPANAYQFTDKRAQYPRPKNKIPYQMPPPALMASVEVLYSETNDGEITIEVEPSSGLRKLVTAIDISSLYKEKRNNAIQLAKRCVLFLTLNTIFEFIDQAHSTNFRFETLYHEYLISPLCPVIMDGNKLYFQTEAPENGNSCWKAF